MRIHLDQQISENIAAGMAAYLSGAGAGKIDVLDLNTWELEEPIGLTPCVDGMSRLLAEAQHAQKAACPDLDRW